MEVLDFYWIQGMMFLLSMPYDTNAHKPHMHKRWMKFFKKRALIWPRLQEKEGGREKREN